MVLYMNGGADVANQKIIEGQPAYKTDWVWKDTTTKADEGWGGF